MANEETPQASVAAAFKERLSHPVIGIFAIIWLLFNWRTIFYLAVSETPAGQRIIEAYEYCDPWRGWIGPILVTSLYVLFSPILKFAANWWADYVADKESARRYELQLETLCREAEIAQKRIRSREQLVSDQQSRLSILESEILNKTNDLELLKKATSDVEELILAEAEVDDLKKPMADVRCRDLAQRFVRVVLVKEKLIARYPSMKDFFEKSVPSNNRR